ncbi:GNAT family N-acetyltransferase [Streptomyces sp. RFCAC02]|uniref:GNAT family N-acetyltransferase n=1 Tax=Streptomyces sp. RFCAC02 TaxID=2499143 RepID=UPI0010222D82|nr:GNAT family N-acetyltransferase [Streptomyces sp. RFCAC02]
MTYTVRRTAREDWWEFRALRLAALRDPVAPLAFYEAYEEAIRLPRSEWERRAADDETVTLIGETEAGEWGGMLGHYRRYGRVTVVGVYVLPAHRGTGLAHSLMETVVEGAAGREIRLRVHEDNTRAARFYRSLGFTAISEVQREPGAPGYRTYELALRPARR